MGTYVWVGGGSCAFNEERYVASVLVRLRECVDRVIVCDDGSVDLTGDIAEALGVTVVRR